VHRPDTVSFTGEPLEAAIDVTGRVFLRLRVSSDRPDTDFIARVIDIYPNGYAMNVAEGQIRMRYRNGDTMTSLSKPGEVHEIPVDLGWTSHFFGAGHRIRLDITSSSFPKLEPNPNTGEFRGEMTHRVKARNSIHHSPRHSSRLLLPVVR
jgi:putative CocE/NonD family hydrolase